MTDTQRYIRVRLNVGELTSMSKAIERVDGSEIDFMEFESENTLVFAGNVFALKRKLTEVAKEQNDETAHDLRLRVADIQREQKQFRGSA